MSTQRITPNTFTRDDRVRALLQSGVRYITGTVVMVGGSGMAVREDESGEIIAVRASDAEKI